MGTALAVLLLTAPAACGGDPWLAPPQATTSEALSGAEMTAAQAAFANTPMAFEGYGKYLAGRFAQASSDTGAAADYYTVAVEYAPDNVMLLRRAYFFALAEGRIDTAVALAERVITLDPKATVAPLVLAAHAAAGADYAGALTHLDGHEPVGLNSFMLPLMRAWALAGLDRFDEAVAVLETMGVQPELAQLRDFHTALILDLAGRDAVAWQYYEKTLAADAPLSLRALQAATDFLRRQGRTDDALKLFARYRTEHPGSLLIQAAFEAFQADGPDSRLVADARQGMAEALYSAASSIVQTNALDTAQAFARLALLLRPGFPFPLLMIGDILSQQDRPVDALETYRSIAPDSTIAFPVRLRIADTLDTLDRLSEAEAVLRELARTRPDSAEPLLALGDMLRRHEEWSRAVDAYRAGLARIGTPREQHWAVYYSLGIALERAGRWDEAEQAFLTALDLKPAQPLVLNYLGYSWIDRGENLDKGKDLIKQAVAQRPTDGYIVDSLGWVYYLLGDYARAVKELERAIELQPADATINDHLGDALWRTGRQREARFQWQRALSLDPPEDVAEKIRRKLEEGLPPPPPVPSPGSSPDTSPGTSAENES